MPDTLEPSRPLGQRELLLIAYLLDQGADAIFKRICEDIHPDALDLFSPAELDALNESYEGYNSGGEDFEPSAWSHQGSVWSLVMAHRVRLLLAAQLGIPVATRYNDTEVMQQLNGLLRLYRGPDA